LRRRATHGEASASRSPSRVLQPHVSEQS
jgi:hypothetical protein